MPGWMIFAIFVMLIFLALCAQVRVRICSGSDINISISYLFFSHSLSDEPKEPPKESKPKKPQKQKAEKKKEKPPTQAKLGVALGDVSTFISGCLPPIRKMFNSIKINNLNLSVWVGGEDVAQIAEGYGKMCIYLSLLEPMLHRMFKTVKIKSLCARPDFLSDSTRVELDVTLGIRPVRVIYTVIAVIFAAMPIAIKLLFPARAEGRVKRLTPQNSV